MFNYCLGKNKLSLLNFLMLKVMCFSSILLFANYVMSETLITGGLTQGVPTNIVSAGDVIEINGGLRKGTNLFHSFDSFSVRIDETAKFNNDTGQNILNILSRVSGGMSSLIKGRIQANKASGFENTNFFLMNPAGIKFGSGAILDIEGSVHVTTADFLGSKDSVMKFYADPVMESRLTVSAVETFGFLHNPGPINIEDSFLEIKSGSTLSLVGGNITIKNSNLESKSGLINIVSVGSNGDVSLQKDQTVALTPNELNALGIITIDQGSVVDVSSGSGNIKGQGVITIRGGKFFLDNSSLLALNESKFDGAKVSVDIDSKENIEITNDATVSTNTNGNRNLKSGKAGDIKITTKGFMLVDNAKIESKSNAFGGNTGDIVLKVGQLSLTNNAQISSNITGSRRSRAPLSKGGTIEITAQDNVQIFESSFLTTSTSGKAGSAGSIRIMSPNLVMDGGRIQATSTGQGKAGDIVLNVNSVEVREGGLIFNETKNTGTGGKITIRGHDAANMSSVEINISGQSSKISSSTEGNADGGVINLKASKISLNDGATISSESAGSKKGNAGKIEISEVSELTVSDRSKISSSTSTTGNAGEIKIENAQLIDVKGTITTDTTGNLDNAGNAGNVILKTNKLLVQNGGIISSQTSNDGNAGNIEITAKDQATLSNNGTISSKSTGLGEAGKINFIISEMLLDNSSITTEATQSDGGNITIEGNSPAKLVSLRNNSAITATVDGGPETTGGNINIDSDLIIAQNSRIIAKAFEGSGGNINIKTQGLFVDPNSEISASSDRGIDGAVEIDAEIEVIDGVLGLPETYVSNLQLRQETCAKRLGADKTSSFTIVEKSGMPISPETLQSADYSNDPEAEKSVTNEPRYIKNHVSTNEQNDIYCRNRNTTSGG